jgi:hypothetical protein
MKKVLLPLWVKLLCTYLFFFVVSYLLGAFYSLSFNPALFSADTREFVVLLTGLLGTLAAFGVAGNHTINK